MAQHERGDVGPIFGAAVAPSAICLGTASFGTKISREDSFAVLDAFVTGGGNFLDTAYVYAAWREGGAGASERTIGEWLRANRARDAVVLATKGGCPLPFDGQSGKCSKDILEKELTESLARLGVDSVDLYWLHRDEPKRPVAEVVETLAGFGRDGRIRSFGGSNWTTARIDAANAYAVQQVLPSFVASQPRWSLVDVDPKVADPTTISVDEDIRRWHAENKFPCVPYSSQGRGYFGVPNVSWAERGFAGDPPAAAEYDSPASRRRLVKAIELAREHDCTPNQIALAFLLSQPFPVFPIIGTGNSDHVREALAALSITLSPAECDALRG